LSANIKQAKNKYKTKFDLQSDYSLQKYISDTNILQNKKYAPSDLVSIDTTNIVDKAGRSYLRQPAKLAFAKMAKKFNIQFDKQFYLMSAYRTYGDQAILFEYGCSLTRCAKI
jgi:LAS superfamily LD-carboxypeptidase LdcB